MCDLALLRSSVMLARRFLPFYLSLTLAYVASGRLALLLAVPPGYASPIFPPAGISVAGVLIGGWATLPWTFLGSFLLNLLTCYSAGQKPIETCFVAAVVIAAASMLQAAISGAIFRRAVGYPAPLDNGRDLARFLFLSPLVCLTSATLSLGGLSALGLVQLPDLAANWVSWWIGDTLGVVVVFPLTLVIAGEPRALWRSRAQPVALPMLLFFALFVAIFVRVSDWEHDQALLEFRLLSRGIVDKINAGLNEQEVFLEQLERSFTRPAPVSRADFQHLAKNLLRRFPTIQAVKWAPRVDLAERAAFEQAQQPDFPGFEIREIDPSRQPRRAAERDWYYPVTYVEPLQGNEHTVGFDLFSEAGRKMAVEETIKTQRVTATPPIRLVQENGDQPGILALLAVQDGPSGPAVVSVALRMSTFVSGILAPLGSLLTARVIDVGKGEPLYNGFSAPSSGSSYNEMFAFGGRLYRVETEPTATYLKDHRGWESRAVLVVGVVGTGLLGALLLISTGYTRRIERVVDDRTRDLESINRRLQREVKERERAEAALHQAQKMEAIGQLTGSIAHDFNNLLTVVTGNAELLHDEAADDRAARRASAIRRAATQGERLTRQLLSFSRRQMLRPEPVDLRERTHEIAEMLSRSLRQDIVVSVEIPQDLWPVVVDPAEFELALLNLGVNARDAMPNGGRFLVEAHNLSFGPNDLAKEELVGDFVAVTLSDTGTGMTAEVQARAFEPYFTTKAVGVGTGLGLSQVYGFARQSGGAAWIESEVGRGTSITLCLPRATESSTALFPTTHDTAVTAVPARLLLVEDDVEVAGTTTELLREIGLQVVWVRDGKSALATFERDPTIEIVMSDIVVPGGMSGLELAHAMREHHPGVPVLLTTGYSQYASQVVREGFTLVEKPYRRDVLAVAIRRAAERSGPMLSRAPRERA
ncbi:MAG: CHASE domain-containing protein [Alphaproteobacteria bacterium]|nr:CHASE domain-containing protein [Alphaproteobacteria bacterium]